MITLRNLGRLPRSLILPNRAKRVNGSTKSDSSGFMAQKCGVQKKMKFLYIICGILNLVSMRAMRAAIPIRPRSTVVNWMRVQLLFVDFVLIERCHFDVSLYWEKSACIALVLSLLRSWAQVYTAPYDTAENLAVMHTTVKLVTILLTAKDLKPSSMLGFGMSIVGMYLM